MKQVLAMILFLSVGLLAILAFLGSMHHYGHPYGIRPLWAVLMALPVVVVGYKAAKKLDEIE